MPTRYIGFMAKQSKDTKAAREAATGMFIGVGSAKRRGQMVTTTLGNVTVSSKKPSAAVIKANVTLSSQALQRLSGRLVRAGVALPQKKGVPRYSVDEDNPKVFIRKLDGQISRGHLINGKFEEIS